METMNFKFIVVYSMKWLLIFVLALCFSNSRAQNMLADISEKSNSLPYRQTVQKILQYGEQLRQPHLPAEQQKLTSEYNLLNNQYKDTIVQYIQKNPNVETAGILALSYYFDVQKDSGFLRQSLVLMQNANTQNQYVQYIKEELNGLDSGKVGKKIPVFQLTDANNQVQTFPNGKKTLLVFWASWCIPCRVENSTLKKQYALLQQKGIAICSVNLDETKTNWTNASQQDQFTWNDCFGGNAFSSRIARFFTIHQIPQNVLLDGDGTILVRNISLNQLLK